jgi:transposase InsO family protein
MLAFLFPYTRNIGNCISNCGGIPLRAGAADDTMAAADVTDTLEDTLEDALRVTGLSEARERHKPRLLSDNGPCYVSSDLRTWLKSQNIEHTEVRRIIRSRRVRSKRHHESLDNFTPADAYEGRRNDILDQRARLRPEQSRGEKYTTCD